MEFPLGIGWRPERGSLSSFPLKAVCVKQQTQLTHQENWTLTRASRGRPNMSAMADLSVCAARVIDPRGTTAKRPRSGAASCRTQQRANVDQVPLPPRREQLRPGERVGAPRVPAQ